MDLSIIIVNYKSADLAVDCIRTIYAETSFITFEIIVVDNDSQDNSRDSILNNFPSVRWIDVGYNAGFARANNVGIRASQAPTILLLNADTLIECHAVERCFKMFAQSTFVACGVQLLNRDRTPQISGNYFMKGGLNYLLPLPYFGTFVKATGDLFKVKKPHVENADAEVQVDWVNGAYLMVKKAAITKAGLLDEDFFLYSEESEWCYRLRKQGRICIYGDCKVVHLQGETTGKFFNSQRKGYDDLSDRKGLQVMVSIFVRLRKQFGVGWVIFNLAFYLFEIPVFFSCALISLLFHGKKATHTVAQAAGFAKNVARVLSLTPTIIRNKPHFYKML